MLPISQKNCKSASWNLKRIRLILLMLDKEFCVVPVCSLVLSHLEYANGNLYGVANYLLKGMQRIQNYDARVILQIDKKLIHYKHYLNCIGCLSRLT